MANRKQSTFERLSSGPLNRQQRRELARKLTAEHPGLEIVNRNVAGMSAPVQKSPYSRLKIPHPQMRV